MASKIKATNDGKLELEKPINCEGKTHSNEICSKNATIKFIINANESKNYCKTHANLSEYNNDKYKYKLIGKTKQNNVILEKDQKERDEEIKKAAEDNAKAKKKGSIKLNKITVASYAPFVKGFENVYINKHMVNGCKCFTTLASS